MSVEQTGWTILIALLSAVGGGTLKSLIDWLLNRGERQATRDFEQAAANDRLGAELREELRKEIERRDAAAQAEIARRDAENQQLRDRLSKVEGRAEELSKTNESLRGENLHLAQQNASQQVQLAAQAAQIARMQTEIDKLRAEQERRPGTGPLPAMA